jgi:hypothetical protein
MFRSGDIVEAHFTFTAVPVRGGKYKLMLVLRALTMLDYSHTMVSVNSLHWETVDAISNL